jgi:hypothetical protein
MLAQNLISNTRDFGMNSYLSRNGDSVPARKMTSISLSLGWFKILTLSLSTLSSTQLLFLTNTLKEFLINSPSNAIRSSFGRVYAQAHNLEGSHNEDDNHREVSHEKIQESMALLHSLELFFKQHLSITANEMETRATQMLETLSKTNPKKSNPDEMMKQKQNAEKMRLQAQKLKSRIKMARSILSDGLN